MKDLKDAILEFVGIAKLVPENLQPTCFQVLLKDFLERREALSGRSQTRTDSPKTQDKVSGKGTEQTDGSNAGQEDITQSDLHVKVRKFMEKEKITIAHLNNLFYKEGERILPIFDDLKTTRMSESQIRIALLKALLTAIKSGNFEAQVEDVRSECTIRKCYDASNFTANFKNNAKSFDFKSFDTKTVAVRLSEKGKNVLGDVIRELQ